MPNAMINRLQDWNKSMAKSLWEKGRSGYTMSLQALSGWECIMSHPDPRARTDTPWKLWTPWIPHGGSAGERERPPVRAAPRLPRARPAP